jgi:hypothetical protein
VSPRFSLEAKRCEKVANLGEANQRKKGLFRKFECFRKIAKAHFLSEKGVRNEAKRSEKGQTQ